jgi:hypothetical protein
MKSEWLKLRIMHGVIAAAIASVVSIGFAWLAFWGSALYFVHAYPHDGLDGLGALFNALLGGMASWGIVFVLAMHWQHVWAWRRQAEQQGIDAKPHFTITGYASPRGKSGQ